SIKRITPEVNRYRTILPRQPCVPPPPQEKISPERISVSQVETRLHADPDHATSSAIVSHIARSSRLPGREVVHYTSSDPKSPARPEDRILRLRRPGSPCLRHRRGDATRRLPEAHRRHTGPRLDTLRGARTARRGLYSLRRLPAHPPRRLAGGGQHRRGDDSL